MFQGSIELSKYSPNLLGLRTIRDLCQSRVSDQSCITLIPKRCKAEQQRVEVEEDETQKTRAKTL